MTDEIERQRAYKKFKAEMAAGRTKAQSTTFHGYFMSYAEMTALNPNDGDTAMVEGVKVKYTAFYPTDDGSEPKVVADTWGKMPWCDHWAKYGFSVHAPTGMPHDDWIDARDTEWRAGQDVLPDGRAAE